MSGLSTSCGAKTLPVTGYLDRLSARPNEKLRAFLSTREADEVRIRLVRVISADPNPAGPGMQFEDLSDRLDLPIEARAQPISLGSYGVAPVTLPTSPPGLTLTALVRPAIASDDRQAVLSLECADGSSFTLYTRPDGIMAEWRQGLTTAAVEVSGLFLPGHWYRLWASLDFEGQLVCGVCPMHAQGKADTAAATASGAKIEAVESTLMVGARGAKVPADHFDGRIEDPAVLAAVCRDWQDPLVDLASQESLIAGWDFARSIGKQILKEATGRQADMKLVNDPMAAVRGSRWTGEEMCWRHCPGHYAAIHFHSDDLGDCGWQESFCYVVPGDLSSGSYAFHLTCEAGQDWLPFYVLPHHDAARPAIAFLASTFTYQAYANHARGNCDESLRARMKAWDAYPYNADDYPIYGRSTYNRHIDNSGISFSSRLRPMLTMRPGYLTFNDPKGSGLRHYPADTHLLAWLEEKGIAFDIVTDEDLHKEGAELLAPYKLVLTGTHPEYHTAQTWDAIWHYTRSGGRLAYLGGNGFYWRIGRDDDQPGLLEMRRSEGGTRAWACEPGEYYNALDGYYSGMWRRNGRDPQQLVGIGFTGQGLFESTYYRRSVASYEARFNWLFDGVDTDKLGDYGLSAGGAAGFEFDRADITLGTPPDATVLATSEDQPASFFTVLEELLTTTVTVDGHAPADLTRADMVYFELQGGGALFSAGSITFCGSLWRDGLAEGPVSQLLSNLITKLSV